MKTSIHWFRRDLRVADNTAFNEASCQAATVHPLFILDEEILAAPDMGAARIAFLLDSLRNLSKNLSALGFRLTVRRGKAGEELIRFCRETKAEAVFCNRDYEPHCHRRDNRVFHELNSLGIGFECFKDAVVWEEKELLTKAGRPYTIFTPYAKAWRERKVPSPRPLPHPVSPSQNSGFHSLPLPVVSAELGHPLRQTIPEGGEHAGGRALNSFLSCGLARYGEQRDYPVVQGTSLLSPHLHFGTVNIRTILDGVRRIRASLNEAERKNADVFVNELIWREFYLQILTNFPQVAAGAFRREYDALAWKTNQSHFDAWRAGQTGYPIVDAAMRCLNATGWMHNRNRMIVAMFLTKDLLLPWQWGERHFMQSLVDGDQAANNGGWQWSAGTGTDAAPYFRIFNPVSQGERFDPEGAFTRQWVPELSALPGAAIHQPWKHDGLLTGSYPKPIIRHEEQRKKCLAMFKSVR